jgi:hypothetical protein
VVFRVQDGPHFGILLEQFQEKCERFSVRNCVKTKG